MTDFALPQPATRETIAHFDWLARLRHALALQARLARRRRFRDRDRAGAHDWMLALPQSRHGG